MLVKLVSVFYFRLQRAREEVAEHFKHTALGEGKRKYPKVMIAKLKMKQKQMELEKALMHASKAQTSGEVVTADFEGVPSDDLEKSHV